MIISIDYDEEESYDMQIESIAKTFDYLYNGLKTNGINANNVMLMGDSTGSTLILNIINKLNIEDLDKIKFVLFYPVILDSSLKIKPSPIDFEIVTELKEYYQNVIGKKTITSNDILKGDIKKIPNTTIICGNVDPMLEKVKKLTEKSSNIDLKLISFSSHNFLFSKDKEIKKEYKKIIVGTI